MRIAIASRIRILNQTGFTLIELLVVMGIFAVLAGVVTASLVRPQAAAPVSSTVNEIVADLRSQQLKAMLGDSGTATSAQAHGMYIQANQYTLFKGSAYGAGDADNAVVSAKTGTTLSTTFPSGQVIFAKGTGEVTGFTGGSNTISVTSNVTGSVSQITVNRLGVITVSP